MKIRRIEDFDIKVFFSGARLSLFYAVIFILVLMFNMAFGSVYYANKIREGEVSLRSIYAPYDFRYPWGINEEKTKKIQDEVLKTVPVVFDIDHSREEEKIKNLSALFEEIKALDAVTDYDRKQEACEAIKQKIGIAVRNRALLHLAGIPFPGRDEVKARMADILKSIFPIGIIDSEKKNEIGQKYESVKIRNLKLGTERTRPIGDVLNIEDARSVSMEYVSRAFPGDSKLQSFTAEVIFELTVPNLVYNETETNKLIDETIKNIPPIYEMQEIKKNELIVERGERITKKHIAQLSQLGAIGGITNKVPYIAGILLLIIILISVGAIYIFVTERKLISSPKEVGIILINSFIIILISQFIIKSPQPDCLTPLAGMAMLITLLISPNAAFISSFISSIFLGVITGGKIETIIVLFIGGLVGAFIVRDARRRSRIIIAGLVSGIFVSIGVIALGLINNLDIKIFTIEAMWGLVGGGLSIFFVMGLLPLFEYLFKLTTNITLLELSDLNQPLLKELTLKAPGTYQHSVVVGNLAEAACEAIGANSLLARVGSYYHDIGKIEKAEYYSENEMGARSKHEKLAPSMSALVIINHVKDGIELAKKYNLNPRIADFVAEHHGTSLIYFFYQRALEKVKDDQVLKEEEFRYPGPKPQTREAAIVLLADSVEASSRALSDPTPARIRGLVQKIINNKFIDNQLDECDLTLRDLNIIAYSFVRVLTAVFHARLEYPEKRNNEDKKVN